MKKTFNIAKKTALFIAAIILLSSLLSLVSMADTDTSAEWTISDDGTTIFRGSKKYNHYTYYGDDLDGYFLPINVYRFSERLTYGEGTEDEFSSAVFSYSDNPEFVWIADFLGNKTVFATNVGEAQLDSFFYNRGWKYCYIYGNNSEMAEISRLSAKQLEIDYDTKANYIMDVKELESVEKYEILLYNETNTFAYVLGLLFFIDDEVYFVDYNHLENNQFTSDGNFSYRSGTVSLLRVTDESIIKAPENLTRYSPAYTYEEDDYYYDYNDYDDYYDDHDGVISVDPVVSDDPLGLAGFVVFFVLGCFIIPVVCIILGMVFATSDKLGRPKYWYSLAISGAVWLVSAVIMFILVVILN